MSIENMIGPEPQTVLENPLRSGGVLTLPDLVRFVRRVRSRDLYSDDPKSVTPEEFAFAHEMIIRLSS